MTGTVYFHVAEMIGPEFQEIHQSVATYDPSWDLRPGIFVTFEGWGTCVIWDVDGRKEIDGDEVFHCLLVAAHPWLH